MLRACAAADVDCVQALLQAGVSATASEVGLDGITPAMVANRDVVRQGKTDENAKLAAQRAAHEAEIRNAFFEVIADSLMAKAPLMLTGLRARHKQTAPFENYFGFNIT